MGGMLRPLLEQMTTQVGHHEHNALPRGVSGPCSLVSRPGIYACVPGASDASWSSPRGLCALENNLFSSRVLLVWVLQSRVMSRVMVHTTNPL